MSNITVSTSALRKSGPRARGTCCRCRRPPRRCAGRCSRPRTRPPARAAETVLGPENAPRGSSAAITSTSVNAGRRPRRWGWRSARTAGRTPAGSRRGRGCRNRGAVMVAITGGTRGDGRTGAAAHAGGAGGGLEEGARRAVSVLQPVSQGQAPFVPFRPGDGHRQAAARVELAEQHADHRVQGGRGVSTSRRSPPPRELVDVVGVPDGDREQPGCAWRSGGAVRRPSWPLSPARLGDHDDEVAVPGPFHGLLDRRLVRVQAGFEDVAGHPRSASSAATGGGRCPLPIR